MEDTIYREKTGGRAEPIQKIEYRMVKLDDGRAVPLLMARAIKGDPVWIGVRDGNVYRQE